MTIRISRVFLLIFFMLIVNNYAYWEWTPKTRSWVNPKYAVKGNPEEQFQWAEELRNEGYLEKSISEHKKLIKHFPNSEYAPESHFVLGKIYKENNDIKRAFNYFEKILDKYPASPRTIEVINMIMDTGEQKLSRPSRKVLRFLKDDKEKGKMLAGILEQYPYIKDADEKSIQLGKFYIEIKEYYKAKDVFLRLIDKTSTPDIREEAYFLLVKSEYFSVSSVTTNIEGLQKVKSRLENFILLYPDTKYMSEILEIRENINSSEAKKYFEIASFYEKSGKQKSANYYYKIISDRYPDTHYGKISADKISSND